MFSENFDAVPTPFLPAGWTTASTGNSVPWTTSSTQAFSTPNAAFSGLGSDNPDQTSLFSPVIQIQGLNPVLSFQNFYDLELGFSLNTAFDAAYLEISVNGGAFVDIISAGGVFLSGGYNVTAETGFGNLFPNRAGWSGTSGGVFGSPAFELCTVDLSNVVSLGGTVQFRWLTTYDDIFRSPGQRIDDVVIDATPLNQNERYAVGSDAGVPGLVRVYSQFQTLVRAFDPFPGFLGGIRVATGDLTGDGVDDIVAAAGSGAQPAVVAYNGATFQEMYRFFAYDVFFQGGSYVDIGDVNGDGFGDIITGAGAGAGPHVKAFSGLNGREIRSFFAPASVGNFGAMVSSIDIDNDGVSEIAVAGATGGTGIVHVLNPFTGAPRLSFNPFGAGFQGGVSLASGDFNPDGIDEIIIGSATGSSRTIVIDLVAGQVLSDFLSFDPAFQGGVQVASTDLEGDGFEEIIVISGFGAPGHVRRFGPTLNTINQFFAFDFAFTGGAFIG
jgi:hypothetical protein